MDFKRLFTTILLVSIITITSCAFSNSNEEELINGYFVGWADMEANRSIGLKDSLNPNHAQIIISSYVYSVGFDDRYILAKTLPSIGNKEFKKYYILDTEGNYESSSDNGNLQSFANEDDFKVEISRKGLTGIKFTKNYTLNP